MIDVSFTVTPSVGDVLSTDFTFVNTTTSTARVKYTVWDFGDNSNYVYNIQQPTHVYQYPGTYTIKITSANILGETDTFQKQITANLLFRDYILFTQIPDEYPNPGKKTDKPFKINVLTSQVNLLSSIAPAPIVVDLFCINSQSIPYQYVPKRWSFLNPTWRFTDTKDNVITSLSAKGIPIYKNKRVVALSAELEFYFIDSKSPGYYGQSCPLLLTCTLQTSAFPYPLESSVYPYPTYTNNKNVKGAAVWYVNNVYPNQLKVTSNYLKNMYSQYWKDSKIPFLITTHYNRINNLNGAENELSDIVFTYPPTNLIGSNYPISATLTKLTKSQYTLDEAPLYFQTTDQNNFRTGGYIFTTLTPSQTATNTVLQVSANIPQPTVFQERLNNYLPNPFVFVSNPERGALNKISLAPIINSCPEINAYKALNILAYGDVKQYPVPTKNSNDTFNYNMSGFSGIYSMAIDPRDYSVIACDAELERIYKFSSNGVLLKTFNLSSLETQKAFFVNTFNITTPLLSTNSYNLSSSIIPLSDNENNFIVSVDGVIQPQNSYHINSITRTIQFLVPNITPNSNARINVVQLFNPLLPEEYINTITTWVSSSPLQTTSFYLPGTTSLLTNSKYYFVSIDGVLQSSFTYTLNITNRTINFNFPIPENTTIQATFLPKLDIPASWTYKLNTSTNFLPLTGDIAYKATQDSSFFVNIGGVFQPTISYTHDIINSRLVFNDTLPTNVPIIITQTSIPDEIESVGYFTPSSVTMDENYNFWITFFNNLFIVKFDSNFNVIKIPGLPTPGSEEFNSDFLLKPSTAETDRNNNCWVTYAHPLCSCLLKYDSSGNILKQINLKNYSVPVSLAITLDNNIWVANITNVLSATGNIQLYDNDNYTLIKSITGIPRPSYLAIDNYNNLWFTHSINGLGYYNLNTDTLRLWTINNSQATSVSSVATLSTSPDVFKNDEEIGGLGIDGFNRVWFINSYTNTINTIINSTPNFTNSDIYSFVVRPNSVFGYYVDLNTGATITESNPIYQYRSAQASGDWTGIKWYQKYIFSNQEPDIITGKATPFSIINFENKNNIRRVNESFNNAEYLKSLALPEILKSNTFLWDKFIPATVGNAESSTSEDLGQNVYEKIANFLYNHADIDTCNIEQLISLANETNVFAANYITEIPAEIKRMLDIGSISKNKLFGTQDVKPVLNRSLGEELNPYTTYLTAGKQIILRSKLDNTYNLLTIQIQNNTFVYPLSELQGYNFAQPITNNYQFFTFKPYYANNYIENIIDWDSEFTTLNPTNSSFEEWYGDNGILELTFNYLLTKNLFLK